MDRVKISACYIAKNEGHNIEQSLQSIKDIADEIIFVDTGSTDGTYEKLKEDTRVTIVEQKEIKP